MKADKNIRNFFYEVWLYVTGQPWGRKTAKSRYIGKVMPDEPLWVFWEPYPKALWQLTLTGEWSQIWYISVAPCCFHRWMQRVILGFKYRRTR